MTALIDVELEVLREWMLGSNKWLALRIIGYGADALKGNQGGSCAHGLWLDYDGTGITRTRPEPVVKVIRSKIAAWRLTLPAGTYLEAAEHAGLMSRSQANHPPFTATAKARGCGRGLPSGHEGPLTEARTLYEAEWDDWNEQRYLPWLAESRAIDKAAADFLAALFVAHEVQTSLFDLAVSA